MEPQKVNRSAAHFPTSNQATIVGCSHQTGKLHKIVTLAVALIGLSAIILGSISIYASHINDTSLNVIKISDLTGGVTLLALGSLMMVYFFHRISKKQKFNLKDSNQSHAPTTVSVIQPIPASTPTIPQPYTHTLMSPVVTPVQTPIFNSIPTVPKEITNKLFSWESPNITTADRNGALYVALNPQNSVSTSGESDQNLYVRVHGAPSIESFSLESNGKSNGIFKIGFNTNQYSANRSQFLTECSKNPNYTLGEHGDCCIVRIRSISEMTWILNLLDQENCLPNIPDNIRTAFNDLFLGSPDQLKKRFAEAGIDTMNIPEELGFCDPISCDIMFDPVTIQLDPTEKHTTGELATFDRQVFNHIVASAKSCPITQRKVLTTCTPNLTLKQAMIDYITEKEAEVAKKKAAEATET